MFWRIDFDIKGASGDYVGRYNSGDWQAPSTENDWPDDGNHSPGGYEWRNRDPDETFYNSPYSLDGAQ